MTRERTLGWLLIALAAGLAVNSVLGPLGFEAIRYHYSETIRNQGIGLDAVSMLIAAPVAVVAALLAWRGHPAGSLLAFAPATYTVYMMPQYVIGPEYLELPGNNENYFALHFGLFVLAVATAVVAWQLAPAADRIHLGTARRRGAMAFLFAFPVFLVLALYLRSFADALSATPERREYLDNPTAFWIVSFLDLAIAAPAAVGSGVAMMRRAPWSTTALYALAGWFALTPPSVAAMAMVMVANDDPNGSAGQAAAFVVFAIVFAAFAAWLYWPVFRRRHDGGVPFAFVNITWRSAR